MSTPLVGFTLVQIRRPTHVVHVEGCPVGVQVKDPGDGPVEQCHVVADHHDSALRIPQEVTQPHDGVRVEMVRRLVEEQRLRLGEQDSSKLDPPTLSAGQGSQGLLENSIRQPETGGDRRGLALGGISTAGQEFTLQPGIPAHPPFVHA